MNNKQYTPMTISEAIAHAEERSQCGDQCAVEHGMLATWLRDYQKLLGTADEVSDLLTANAKLADALGSAIGMIDSMLGSTGINDEVKVSEICDIRTVHFEYMMDKTRASSTKIGEQSALKVNG